MRTFDRFNIKAVGIAGLCGAAIALSPDAAAAPPIKTGGAYACVQGMSGEAGAPPAGGPAAAGAPAAAGGAAAAGGPAIAGAPAAGGPAEIGRAHV